MCLFQLSSAGEVDVNVNMQKVLSKYNGPKDLNSLLGKYLYIAVLVEESTGEHGSLLLARFFEILKYLICGADFVFQVVLLRRPSLLQ